MSVLAPARFATAGSTAWYVDASDCGAGGTGTKESPFCTIQEGIVAAANADEVVVAPATYLESIDLMGKAITVRSSNPDDPATVRTTIIDGNGAWHVVRCTSGETNATVISGFTITGGNANGPAPDNVGGGMFCVGAGPMVKNCIFYNNRSSSFVGGLYLENAGAAVVEGCTFTGNLGAAVQVTGSSNPRIHACTFIANGDGVVVLAGASARVSACNFVRGGRGMNVFNVNTTVEITGCRFTGCFTSGLWVQGRASATISNCVFSGNGDNDGPAIYANGSTKVTVTNSLFAGNFSSNRAGAIRHIGDQSQMVLNWCEFHGNSAAGPGGAISNLSGTMSLTDCVFDGNVTTFDGAAVNVLNGTVTATRCTFRRNRAPMDPPFGGVWFQERATGSGTITGCTFIGSERHAITAAKGVVGPTVRDSIFCDILFPFFGAVTDAGGNIFGGSCSLIPPILPRANFDADGDGDVDLEDYARIIATFSGPLP